LYKNPEKKISLEWWPSLQDYNEAIQNPRACLSDPDLRNSLPYTNAVGLPRAVTGTFASVYRMHCDEKDYALRLFLRNIKDQAERYARISEFVQNDTLPYTVTFHFLNEGIRSRGEWLPALKMEWVEGKSFDDYIVGHLHDSDKLGTLAASFLNMMEEMKVAGIAHGDLQHGNIIMCNDEIRLVDYDGMFVPAMKNFAASELGHPNYQHPGREQHHFGPYLDNFSAWIIYASIKALQIDPLLLHQLGGGDDCLLFRKSDYATPLQSAAFAAFEKHENEELRKLGSFIRAQLAKDVSQIPYLEHSISHDHAAELTPIPEEVSNIKEGPRLIRTDLKEWLKKENLGASPDYSHARFDHGTKLDNPTESKKDQYSWTVPAPVPQGSVWVKPTATDFAVVAQSGGLRVDAKGVVTLPPELAPGPVPRWIRWDTSLRNTPPQTFQWLMLVNPIVMYLIYSFFVSVTIDEDLRRNGQIYNATVSSVNRYQSRGRYSTAEVTDVTALFKVNGKDFTISRNMGEDQGKYRKGDVYPIRALPSNPTVQEPFGDGAGALQSVDTYHAVLCLLATIVLELLIWCRPLWHKRLAREGIPAIAKIEGVRDMPGGLTGTTYRAEISYDIGSQHYYKSIGINQTEFAKFQQGSREIILCDPDMPDMFVFYRFCNYKAIYVPPVARKNP
jgi:hypothetical protein